MHFVLPLLLFSLCVADAKVLIIPREKEEGSRSYTNEWGVTLTKGACPYSLEEQGFEVLSKVEALPDTYVVRHKESHFRNLRGERKARAEEGITLSLLSHPTVKWAEQQHKIRHQKDTVPTDPLFDQQWHIINNGQLSGSTAGIDINLLPAWESGYNGTGVTVAIVDDGYQYIHPDLAPAYKPTLSRNFNKGDPTDPAPKIETDTHGTPCAGIVLAERDNGVCGVGVSFASFGAGIRILGDDGITDADQSTAFTFGMNQIDVFSNSYGTTTNGRTLGAAGVLTLAGLDRCRTEGRNGKGNIFVFSAGNGAEVGSNSNYRGYTATRYTIAVAAVDFTGKRAYYSEKGANILVSAPSGSDSINGIRTTDLLGASGFSSTDCTNSFDGTSASCPIVAGVASLMLQANNNLHWRDVQFILATTAKKIDLADSDWAKNGNGLLVNHKYGFGLVDAFAAVAASLTHSSLPVELKLSVSKSTRVAIPDNSATGIIITFDITEDIFVESAVLKFVINHERANEIDIEMISPAGTKSIFAEKRAKENSVSVNGTSLIVGFSAYGPDFTSGNFAPVTGECVSTSIQNEPICNTVTQCSSLPGKIALVNGNASCINWVTMTKAFQDCGAIGVVMYEVDSTMPDQYYMLTGNDSSKSIKIPTMDISYKSYMEIEPVGIQLTMTAQTIPGNLYFNSWSVTTKRVLGERSKGMWTVKIADRWGTTTGSFESATLELFGHNNNTSPEAQRPLITWRVLPPVYLLSYSFCSLFYLSFCENGDHDYKRNEKQ